MPCKRCARKNRECGASYLSRDDPKSTQKHKVIFVNSEEFQEYQEFRKQKITPGSNLPSAAKHSDPSHGIEEALLSSLPLSMVEEPEMELFGINMADWMHS